MLDEPQIQALLKDLPERAIRSGLEPYRELVLELRRRSFSYRQIAKLLVERCGFEISHSAIHDFVQKQVPRRLRSSRAVRKSLRRR